MKHVFHRNYVGEREKFDAIITNFDRSGDLIYGGDRNQIKQFALNGINISVKSFKVPNIFNQLIYNFFRKSKAQRSFEYANILLKHHIGTPQPIAYYEFPKGFLFKKSFYISEHVNYDLTYRELTRDLNYQDHEEILRAFTRFTHKLHLNNINFLDHSPGNTLIKKEEDQFNFYLVDLNRMQFEPMNFKTRVKNFARLTVHKSMIETMSDEYAKCTGEDVEKIFELMWRSTEEFQYRFHRKKRIKKVLKFWK